MRLVAGDIGGDRPRVGGKSGLSRAQVRQVTISVGVHLREFRLSPADTLVEAKDRPRRQRHASPAGLGAQSCHKIRCGVTLGTPRLDRAVRVQAGIRREMVRTRGKVSHARPAAGAEVLGVMVDSRDGDPAHAEVISDAGTERCRSGLPHIGNKDKERRVYRGRAHESHIRRC